MSAVSARPLRAPCVEMKYCSTESPSRKFAVIGVSMTSPEGLDIRPRMPASWRTCSREPRAPESAIRLIGLKTPVSLLDLPHLAEHLLRDLLGHPVPDVDDLVVALTGGDHAGRTLVLDLDHLGARLLEDLRLALRHHHVVDAERDARLGGVEEGDLLDLVEHLDRLVVAQRDEAVADQVLQAALLQQAVDERDLLRQVHVEDHPADGGLDQLAVELLELGVHDVLLVELRVEVDVRAPSSAP